MKKLVAALLASAVMVPMLAYAQSEQAAHDGAKHPSETHTYDHVYDRDYGASPDGSLQSGWATQPSPQALGQSVYMHH